MDEVVAFELGDSGVGLLYPVPDCGLTLAEIIAKDVPQGARYRVISRSDVPTDRSYRNAWVMDFTGAEVNV